MLDKNAPHHLATAQPAAHPSAPDDTDAQRLARLSEELYPEVGTNISTANFKTVTLVILVNTLRSVDMVCTYFLGWVQLL